MGGYIDDFGGPCFPETIGPSMLKPQSDEEKKRTEEAVKKLENILKQRLAEKEQKVKEIAAESTDLAKLMKRADALSYRQYPKNWERKDKEIVTELLAKLLSNAGTLAADIDTYYGNAGAEVDAANFENVEESLARTLVVLLRISSIFAIDPLAAASNALDTFEQRLERIGK